MSFIHPISARRWVTLLALFTASAVASATDYYASPNGTGDGISAPCSIYKARSLAPGDTLWLATGTYPLPVQTSGNANTGPLYPHAGTAANWVHIKSTASPRPVIDGSSISLAIAGGHNVVSLGDYTEWDGIDVANGVDANLATWGSSHITIKNVTSTGAFNAGILIGSGTRGGTPGTPSADLPGTTDITVTDCTITNCSRKNAGRNVTGWAPSLQLFQCNNVAINHCTVYETYGEGIGFRTVSHSTITNCTVTDAYSASVYMDNCSYITISGTSTYGSNSNYYRDGHPASGLLMAVEVMPTKNGVLEPQLGDTYITETSTNSWQGCPGREYYHCSWDYLSDMSTCSFNSTPVGLNGFPAIQVLPTMLESILSSLGLGLVSR